MNALYPIYLKVKGKVCLIAGGGMVALRKAESLSACGARLRIVAPEISDDIRNHFKGRAELLEREYTKNDLTGCMLAIAATDNPSVNSKIASDCRERGILVNSVDDPSNCDFYVPAVIRKGDLQIAISTGGTSPALAGWIRREIEGILSERLTRGMNIVTSARKTMIDADSEGFDNRARAFRDFFESALWRGFLDGTCELSEEGVIEWISSCSDSAM